MIVLIAELNQPLKNRGKASKSREYTTRNQAQGHLLGLTNKKRRKKFSFENKTSLVYAKKILNGYKCLSFF